MAWRTAGRLGPGGGPSGAFFPPSRRCETSVLEEGEGDHSHERMPVQARPRATLEVVEAEFLLELLVSLLTDPTRLDRGREHLQVRVGGQIGEVVLSLA